MREDLGMENLMMEFIGWTLKTFKGNIQYVFLFIYRVYRDHQASYIEIFTINNILLDFLENMEKKKTFVY